jgi:RimJ/RimL family protein N-acetyltransferase
VTLLIPGSTSTITLNRVLLRPFCESDIEGRRRLGRDPEIQRAFGANPSFEHWQPMDDAAAKAWYERQLDHDGPFVWAVETEGRLIGDCRLHTVIAHDERARYAIGILDRELLGQGLGAEITKGILQYAFETAGFHRIDLRVLASNLRAIACYEKCGFVIEGRERESAKIGDRREDDLIMGVLRSEFGSSEPSRANPLSNSRVGAAPRSDLTIVDTPHSAG